MKNLEEIDKIGLRNAAAELNKVNGLLNKPIKVTAVKHEDLLKTFVDAVKGFSQEKEDEVCGLDENDPNRVAYEKAILFYNEGVMGDEEDAGAEEGVEEKEDAGTEGTEEKVEPTPAPTGKSNAKEKTMKTKKEAEKKPEKKAETKKEVPKATAKKAPEKTEKKEKTEGKKESNLDMMKRMLAEKAGDAKIKKAFLAKYEGQEEEFVDKRIAIYKNLASKG